MTEASHFSEKHEAIADMLNRSWRRLISAFTEIDEIRKRCGVVIKVLIGMNDVGY